MSAERAPDRRFAFPPDENPVQRTSDDEQKKAPVPSAATMRLAGKIGKMIVLASVIIVERAIAEREALAQAKDQLTEALALAIIERELGHVELAAVAACAGMEALIRALCSSGNEEMIPMLCEGSAAKARQRIAVTMEAAERESGTS